MGQLSVLNVTLLTLAGRGRLFTGVDLQVRWEERWGSPDTEGVSQMREVGRVIKSQAII